MKVKKLYEHITKHMSVEDALMKLLEGQVMNYKHLKFCKDKEIHPILLVSMAALDMGWNIAIDGKDDDDVIGISIGTNEYLEKFFNDEK